MNDLIYKICGSQEWSIAEASGIYKGAPIDKEDGFIHFSTGGQVRETAAKHFTERADLILVTVGVAALGNALRWEPSRGGQLFPHLYAHMPLAAVHDVHRLPLRDGAHVFPDVVPE